MSVFWKMTRAQGAQASADAAQAQGTARRVGNDLKDLEDQVDRAMLACEAMWTIMRDKLGLTDIELIERINDVDLSDGKLDGKVRKTPVTCPKCGRTIASRFPKCMYCGQMVVHDPFA